MPRFSPDITGILTAAGKIEAEGGQPSACYFNPTDKTAVQVAAVTGGYSTSDPSAPGITRVGSSVLWPVPTLPVGTAIVADPRYLAVAIRRDAAAEFSEHAAWSVDGVSARITMRVDFEPSDLAAFYKIS
jgi:hypothetical protein